MEENEELNKYIASLNCRGCYCHCPLNNPSCGKSRVFINDAIEEFKMKKEESYGRNN